jgi:hypothetical protein
MVALDFDPSIFHRPACTQPCLQLGGKLREAGFIQRQVENDRDSFASPALGFSANSDD